MSTSRQPALRRHLTRWPLWLSTSILLALVSGCSNQPQPANDIGRTYVPYESATSEQAPEQGGSGLTREAAGGGKVIDAPEGIPDVKPTVVSYTDYNDPLISVNRAIFAFNDFSYRYVLIPLANGYVKVLPLPVRNSVTNFFYNLKSPIYLVNNALQLEGKLACRNLARFLINSTLGIAGLFDPAEAWFGLERAEAHFDDTLIAWGADYGMYIVLPLLGPSDLRDGASAITDYFLNPINYLLDEPERFAVRSVDYLQDYASDAERYKALYDKSDDPYILFRNLYLQSIMRDADYE
ncbi:MlaA family lipoprotein [Gilvimarinus agarilyticus]|uniref:MlaA family lipoprotein n=1 Tax=Gilvimarinus agarilyticus TaxID=679259 RepID=UPI000697BC62|nr:VacJ family lipoprotein [Gilvimarinus agarilyticus]